MFKLSLIYSLFFDAASLQMEEIMKVNYSILIPHKSTFDIFCDDKDTNLFFIFCNEVAVAIAVVNLRHKWEEL